MHPPIIRTACYTNIGGRDYNEDTLLIVKEPPGKSPQLFAAMVADGLGGLGHGDVASSAAAKVLKDSADTLAPLSTEGIERLCLEMNQAVMNEQRDGRRMKTTIAAVFFDWETLIFAHVGDSRLYHFREDAILYQSMDHSVSQLAVLSGEISQEEVRFHVDRGKLLRAVGVPEEEFRADVRLSPEGLRPGDAILICSDGFWEHVQEEEMLRALAKRRNPHAWLASMKRTMKRKRIKNQDNNTAIAIFLDKRRGAGGRV